jgi:two-component system NtrC family sensor kinase
VINRPNDARVEPALPQNPEVDAPATTSLPPLLWLERANRLATVARLLENTVHEVNNALQVISGQTELLASAVAVDPAVQQRLGNIGEKARHASTALQELLAFARDAPDHTDRVALQRIAEQAIALRRYSLSRLRIEVAVEPAVAETFVVANERSLLLIALNLVLNAEQALAGRSSRSLRVHTGRQGDTAQLVVEDNGPGLDDAALAWQPEEAAPGSSRLGIGLRVATWLAERHGGQLSWTRPAQGSGCRVTLSLPVVR